jgi:hypothetical protein
MALIEYFFNPYSGNGYKPFTYDFQDTDGVEDFTKQFVTKVMQTHSGQCRSLPMYYRVLAEAIGAKAYIAYAPAHVFIRYLNEDKIYPEDWVNVELTTHQLTPEFWIKDNFEITEKAIDNKIYLYPLTAKETIAAQLADLAFGYWNKYKIYNDFTLNCADKSLKYYPQNPKSLLIKRKSLESALIGYVNFNGFQRDTHTTFLENQLSEVSEQLKNLGWEPMSEKARAIMDEHVAGLSSRPDYDGTVAIAEGIAWAKAHPGALNNPTADNTLYIDASKCDFGFLSTSDFDEVGKIEPQNLFTNANLAAAAINPFVTATVYALGAVDMILLDRNQKTVQIVNNSATDYDWNIGGTVKRDRFIRTNNFLTGINPQIHGFKTYYYGTGRLRK